ncbi:MAG: hypothetical protein KDB80_11830 [Planctomycetes bacterium]|nr:hypothetical protein [Planctomycetota bacterium]
MIEFATLLLTLIPQAPPAPDEGLDIVIATGSLVGEELAASAFGLGSGGLVDGQRAAASVQRGVTSFTTDGGLLLRVSAAGLRVDFPTGSGLFVDARGRVHTKSGAATLPHLHGLDLVLADGARIGIKTASSDGRRPLRSIGVEQHGEHHMLWQSRRSVRNAALRRTRELPRSAVRYYVVGDGEVLYSAERRGPLVDCVRVLCPAEREAEFPPRRLVVIGEGLINSLRELPRRMPEKSIEYPDGPIVARRLASMADRLFPAGVLSQVAGASDRSVIELFGGMKFEAHEYPDRRIVLQLFAPRMSRPLVEWLCDHNAQLHLVRQDGEKEGRGRYFQRGVPVEVVPARAPRPAPR